jgi:5-methyltetrahydrofolate--homocysteine methyltransferase
MGDTLERIMQAVVEGDISGIASLTKAAQASGVTAGDILQNGLMPGMDKVGAAMENGDMFIPEVLLSARTMQVSLELIKPGLVEGGIQMTGKVVLGTVEGDLHTIGKNLVKMMLEGAGFEVIDLDYDVAPAKFVEAVKQHKPDIVGMSALLTTTMQSMGKTIKALQDAGLRESVKIMLGGAPVTQEFAIQVGADGYGANAMNAVEVAKRLVA